MYKLDHIIKASSRNDSLLKYISKEVRSKWQGEVFLTYISFFHFSIIFLFLNLSYLFKRKTKHGTKWYKMCTN